MCDIGRSEIAALEQKRHIVVAGASVGEAITEVKLSVVAAPLPKSSECRDGLVSDFDRDRHDVDTGL